MTESAQHQGQSSVGRIQAICEDALGALQYELVDLELVREQQGLVLRLFIDYPATGERADRENVPERRITLDDCTAASRHVSTVLDVEDPMAEPYRLEVSSPGLRRRIRKEQDFRRFQGFHVRVNMNCAIKGRKNFSGVIQGVEDGMVKIKGDQEWDLPLNEMRKAHLEDEY